MKEWSAWVQAVGSVLGIFVAVAVPWWQRRTALNTERADRQQRARALAILIVPILLNLRSDLERLNGRLNRMSNGAGRIEFKNFQEMNKKGGQLPAFLKFEQFIPRIGDFNDEVATMIADIHVAVTELHERYEDILRDGGGVLTTIDPDTGIQNTVDRSSLSYSYVSPTAIIVRVKSTIAHAQNLRNVAPQAKPLAEFLRMFAEGVTRFR